MFHGTVIALVVLATAVISIYRFGADTGTMATATFMTLALAQIWHVFNMRERRAGLRAATLRNPWVWGAIVLCIAILAIALSTPILSRTLALQPLPGALWGIVLALSFIPLAVGGLVERTVMRSTRAAPR